MLISACRAGPCCRSRSGSAVPVCSFIQNRLKIGTERVREKGHLLDRLFFDDLVDEERFSAEVLDALCVCRLTRGKDAYQDPALDKGELSGMCP